MRGLGIYRLGGWVLIEMNALLPCGCREARMNL